MSAGRRYRILPRADADIDEHFHYIGQEQPDAATRFFYACFEAFEKLGGMPGMGPAIDLPHPRAKGLHFWPIRGFRNHLVLYRAEPPGILVIRVIHGARNLQAVLDDL